MNISLQFLLLAAMATTTRFAHCFSAPAATSATVNKQNTLSDQQIMDLAKEYVVGKNGFYAPIDPEAHSEDFVFRGGVIGPLNKADYCTTMTKLGVFNAFDLNPNSFGFCVDPELKNACRFYVRYTGKQVQPWRVAGTPYDIPISDKPVAGPTESFCIQFDDDGKTKFFTISAPMNFGNPVEPTTGGLGAVLGLFCHVGQDIAAKSAMNANLRTATNFFANLLPADVAPPKTKSNPEELPTWWKE
mmetsp:Transcript_18969/g.28124  ORF Transcript_18969/g.28124 Transcript_18969/m.28124 type:complete len:245 (-) Transcript_18969:149-883(-)